MMNRMYTITLATALLLQGSIAFGQDEIVDTNEVKRTIASGLVALEKLELQKDEDLAGQNGQAAQAVAIAQEEEEAAIEAVVLEVVEAITQEVI